MGTDLLEGDRNGMSYMNLSSDDAVRKDDVRAWSSAEIERWLQSISFSQYVSKFKEHDISGEALLDLDYSLLTEMGIPNIGDRVRLVMSIRSLRDQITTTKTNNFLTSLKLLDDACVSPFATPPRHGDGHVRTVLPISSSHNAVHSPSSANTPNPPSSSMLLDDDHRNTIRFIFSEGRTKVVNIEGAGDSAELIKRMGLAKIGVTDSPDNWIVFVYTSRGPKPLSDSDLIEICRNPKRQERERLILCRQGRTPSTDEFMKSQQIQEAQSSLDDQGDQGDSVRSVHKSKLDKIVSEASSPSIPRPSPKQSGSVIPRIKRLRNFFGQRPPSELISSNLTEYFPGHERTVLEQTVRNSIRQSRQISLASAALNGRMSVSSSRRQSTVGGAWLSVTSEDDTLKLGESFYSSPVDASKEIQDLRKSVIANLTRRSVASMASAGARTGERLTPRISRVAQGVDTPTLIQEAQSESAENTLITSDIDKHLQNYSPEERRDSKTGSPTEEQISVNSETLQKTPTSKADSLTDNHSVITLESELSDEEFDILELQESVLQGPIKWIKGALIGQGTFGSVVLGMNALTGELMAVKQVEVPSAVIDDKRQAMIQVLEHEVSLLKYLQHDNIVQYLGSNSDGQYLNIFLEYVPGGSVATLLNTYGPFEEPLIRNFVRQILLGLKYLHDQGIIHRDIKGANVLVDNKGCIKISDFGISKKIEADLLTTPGSKRPSIQGSVFWMAPEVVKQTSYTFKADIWSLGCLVVEMFTGSHPFPEFSQMQAIFKIGSSCAPTIPQDITDDGKSFLAKSFEADYEKRPTAPELLAHPFMKPIVAGKNRE